MTTPSKKDILDVAATAREIADSAPAGSLQKAAAGAVAVTCATTRDIPHARTVLDGVIPVNVRDAALELFARLAEEEE